jgi:hypothetical protein
VLTLGDLSQVRISATQVLVELVRASNADYVRNNVFPTLRPLVNPSTFYLVRINALEAVKVS